MTWVPADISPICASTQANLTQCSVGMAYLSLLAQLFGNSTEKNSFSEEPEDKASFVNDEELRSDNMGEFTKKRHRYDYIIVGAGSAGCVLANRLSEIPEWNILLIEAGQEEPEVTSIPSASTSLTNSNIDWGYKSQPDDSICRLEKGGVCSCPSGKTMGGSSAINYMTYMRGSRYDYDGWAAEGNVGWSYREILPYFDKSINLRDSESLKNNNFKGTGGPLNVERFSYIDEATRIITSGFAEKGLPVLDLGLESRNGVNINLSTSKNGKRQSANEAFIKPVRHTRPNLHIITNAFATKIFLNPRKKEAFGVQYFKGGKYHKVLSNREVIISSGAINSPTLLKISGVGPREELESLNIPVIADLKVGFNLQDHVTTDALVVKFTNKTSTLVSGNQLLSEVVNYRNQPESYKYGPLSTTSISNSIAFINTNGLNNPPNVQIQFNGLHVADFYSDPTNYMASDILPLSFYDGVAVTPLLLTPKSRGYILLNKTDPIFGPPLIHPGFFTIKEDLDDLINSCKFLVRLNETEAFWKGGASFDTTPVKGCTAYEWGSNDYFSCLFKSHTSTIYHPAGTCKMGPESDEDAVVDPRFRVHGIKRLRVVDASTMSKIVRGNLNIPTIMMAEKASDMIKEDHGVTFPHL